MFKAGSVCSVPLVAKRKKGRPKKILTCLTKSAPRDKQGPEDDIHILMSPSLPPIGTSNTSSISPLPPMCPSGPVLEVRIRKRKRKLMSEIGVQKPPKKKPRIPSASPAQSRTRPAPSTTAKEMEKYEWIV